jgi:MoaA/NifB/PqqE/SkfB family radical SAM enzyme
MIGRSGIPIENITTNAVLLGEEVTDILISGECDQITVSLNTADPDSYSKMMQTPGRNFDRVVANMRHLIAERRRRHRETPRINLQFLVWKENYKTIPQMYALAREIDVDTIFFNGLAFLTPQQKMSDDETREMMRLYEDVIRIDEYRRISIIDSYEQDIRPLVAEMNTRLDADRRKRGPIGRLAHLVARRDVTWREKLAHRKKIAVARRVEKESRGLEEPCIIGWHSLVIRTGGPVAPCCILQGSPLGNIFKSSLREVWYGDGYNQFRRELARIMKRGSEWQPDPAVDKTVVGMCGGKGGAEVCPIKSFYYKPDIPFLRELNSMIAS